MEYVIDHDIKVSNNSWGGGVFSQSLYDAIAASQTIGHIFVASAGNSGENIDDDPHYPASYDLPNIISVAATDNQDGLALFSSGNTSCYGSESVDLGAPGLYVWSTTPVDSYGYKSGTSMAAPHVTGTVALVMSRWPDWPWTEVNQRIMAAVRPVESLIGITVTGGVVNAAKVGDCNTNGIPDDLDIAGGTSEDCTGNGIPDECEPDCNNNGMADSCDVDAGTSEDCNANVIPDECEPDCNHNGTADSCDIRDATSPDCNENTVPDECEPGGLEDCNSNGSPDLCDIHSGVSRDCDLDGVPDECEVQPLGRLYVDQSATSGANTGVTWADAYLDLHRALDHAACLDGEITEIWVAEGTYTPDIRPTNRVDTFELPGGVAVYGGFSGGETSLSERDFSRNETILSGDLDGDDELPGDPVVSDCCMEHDTPGCSHPVCASAVCGMIPSCCTDRWAGSCVYWSLFMCCDLCTSNNRCDNSYHIVTASDTEAAAQLDGFTLRGGYAMHWCSDSGGAIRNLGGNLTVANCRFIENQAKYAGGAIENVQNGALTLVNCVFNRNACVGSGGAMFSSESTAAVFNCLFTGNTVNPMGGSMGGAIFNWPDSDLHYINCTFTGNSARTGGAIFVYSRSSVKLTNCILWGNSAEDFENEFEQIAGADPLINFSCIQGWSGVLGGTGNTGLDPLFVDYDGADNIAGTEDDNLRLLLESPCVDAGDNTVIPPGVTVDLDGIQRFVDLPGVPDSGNGTPPIVDMGAYERGLDCNGNDISDEADIALGTSQDCNDNEVPDECDLADPTIGDCDGNLTPDNCQSDTDTDGLIDECDGCPYDVNKTAPGACGCGVPDDDTDGDTVPDCLDICAGFDDLIDSDSDGTPDGCDRCPGFDDLEDGDGDEVPDGCDDCPYEPALAEPSEPGYEITCDDAIDNDCDTLTDEFDSDCLCQPADALAPEPAAFEKNRYLSFSGANSGRRTAVRVTLTDLPAPFDAFDGQIMWVGEPREISENAGTVAPPPDPSFLSARLQCTPYCMDWAEGLLHVTDDEIVPGAVYNVQAVDCACDFANEVNYSAPLMITTSKWGDVVADCTTCPCGPPDGAVGIPTDVTAVLDKFKNLAPPGVPCAAVIKARADVEPNLPDWLVNVSDVSYVLDAFRGFAYPPTQIPQPFGWTGPGGCP